MAKIIGAIVFLLAPLHMVSQRTGESYDDFRRSLLDGYNKYRTEILSQYGKYLDSLWIEYPQYAGVERNPFPKPKDIPAVKDIKPTIYPKDVVSPMPDNAPAVGDTTRQQPVEPIDVLPDNGNKILVSFYGIPLTMDDTNYVSPDNLSKETVSDLWTYMYSEDFHEPVIKEIVRLSREINLNDYLVFELVREYVNTKFKTHTLFSRNALVHFLLSNMGYDVRLAESEFGKSMILLPFNQMVYARPFLNIGDKKYFVFSEMPLDPSESIYTCFLPSDIFLGETFELKLKELKLPYKPYKFSVRYGDITLTGEINANIYPILYRYPQMPIADYARSIIDREMRDNIVRQFKKALENDGKEQSVEKILHFTQFAFDYATDDENHGFEKPYFFEEIVYYPRCDCEDRAIFYSYLLYNVLGIENHIISYPGHEATSLTIPSESLKGVSYKFDDKTFFISDPTYIGASTGMCMPGFETVQPQIDYIYN